VRSHHRCLGPSGDGNNSDSENGTAPRVFFAAQRKLSSVLAAKSALPHVSAHRQPSGSGLKSANSRRAANFKKLSEIDVDLLASHPIGANDLGGLHCLGR
jgi:hypothetical protein